MSCIKAQSWRHVHFADGHVKHYCWADKNVLKFVSYDFNVPAGDRNLQWFWGGLPQL